MLAGRHLASTWGDPLDLIRIYALARTFDDAADRGDVDAMVSVFHPDAEHRGLTTGRLVRGQEALRRVFAEEFTADAGADDVDTEIVSFRFLTPDVLIADLTVHYVGYRLSGRVWPVFREHTYAVVSRRHGHWRIDATSAGGHDASLLEAGAAADE